MLGMSESELPMLCTADNGKGEGTALREIIDVFIKMEAVAKAKVLILLLIHWMISPEINV